MISGGKMAINSVGVLTIIGIFFFAAFGISAPLISLYLEELGASYSYISVILASSAAVSLLSNYIWGRLSDKLGRRKPLIVGGLLGLALVYELLSRVPSANWAGVVWILKGATDAAYMTPSLALMGDLLAGGGKRGQRMGTYRGLGSLAFALSALIGGRLADLYSLSSAMRFCALFYFLGAVCALALRESTASQSRTAEAVTTGETGEMGEGDGQPLPRLFLIGVFLWISSWAASVSMWPNFMAKLGYSKTVISSLWGFAAFVEAPTMRVVGSFSDLIGRVPLLTAGAVGVTIVMTGYILLARILPALVGVQVIRGLTYASYTASAMTFATEWGERHNRGRDSGLFNAVMGAGQLVGLLVGGTLAEAMGFEFLFAACGVSGLLSAACFWGLRYRQRI